MNRIARQGSALVCAGVALPLLTVLLLPLLIIPAHSEDYGAGLLFIGLFLISLFGGLALCGIGAATLIVSLSSDGSARTMISKVAAALGVICFLALLGYVCFFFTA